MSLYIIFLHRIYAKLIFNSIFILLNTSDLVLRVYARVALKPISMRLRINTCWNGMAKISYELSLSFSLHRGIYWVLHCNRFLYTYCIMGVLFDMMACCVEIQSLER